MAFKWSVLSCIMTLASKISVSNHIFYPLSYECLIHIGQLFCQHLFIDLPQETKLLLLQQYYKNQLKTGTIILDKLFESYCRELLLFHDAILHEDCTLGKRWKSMCVMTVDILQEIKRIQISAGQDAVLPTIRMITLEQVFTIQHELKRSSLKQNLTFSPSGR